MTASSSGEPSTQPNSNGTAGRKELVAIAGLSLLSVGVQQALKRGLLGMGVAAAAWLVERFAGSVIGVPALVSSDSSPPVAALILVVMFYAVMGTVYGIFVVVVTRRLIDGRLIIQPPVLTASRIRPVWWGAMIRDAAIIFAIVSLGAGVWTLGQWLRNAEPLATGLTQKEHLQYLAVIALCSIGGGLAFRVFDLCEWLLGFLIPLMMRLEPVWFIASVVGGAMAGVLFFGLMVGIALITALNRSDFLGGCFD